MIVGYDGQRYTGYNVAPGKEFAGAVMARLNDHHDKYDAGAEMKRWHGLTTLLSPGFSGIGPSDRQEDGYSKGELDAGAITESLHRSGGVIDESIKIITHSMGGAFGKGYVKAILGYAKENKIAGVKIAFEADFAPFQPGDQSAVSGISTLQFSNDHDGAANSWINPFKATTGAKVMTNDNKNKGHSIFDFLDKIKYLPAGN